MMGKGDHISYHVDGSVWNTVNGVVQKVAQFQPLTSFKGSHQLSAMAFSTHLSENLEVPQYKMRKLDSAVYIDVRLFLKRSADVGVNVSLLEPGKYSLLEKVETFAREIHLYPCLNPWLVVTVYFSGYRK